MSGVLPEQAKHLSRAKMDKLMINMYGNILGMNKGVRRLKVKQRRAMYAYCYILCHKENGWSWTRYLSQYYSIYIFLIMEVLCLIVHRTKH